MLCQFPNGEYLSITWASDFLLVVFPVIVY
jgi:hypothetical protein